METPYTGVILAGGQNRRFSGKKKAFLPLGGRPILDRIYSVFTDLFEEIILVTNDPLEYFDWNVTIVTDIFPIRSSMTGIHAGLFYTKTPFAFVSACDIPFLKTELIETILEAMDSHVDVVVPETPNGLEPLCALYAKECLGPLENQIAGEAFKIDTFFEKVRVKKIPEPALRAKDPDLVSFFNINTPDDLRRAQEIENNR
ncbi:MAG: molybdenum cofactor guanylyltransferase [Deltaproteobacteria bacterium]|nr:molybdenum cofactor guanylyltransferase [Deltaproteobacteria bacterium]